MKYVCKVCGYVHEGELPADFICPKCKKDASYFELVNERNKYAGTKTEKNLWTAFAGESQARNKYTYFASVAKKAGYEQIALVNFGVCVAHPARTLFQVALDILVRETVKIIFAILSFGQFEVY